MKATITLTATLEINLKPENYATDYSSPLSPERMLEIELEQMRNDPDIFWEINDSHGKELKITGELVK